MSQNQIGFKVEENGCFDEEWSFKIQLMMVGWIDEIKEVYGLLITLVFYPYVARWILPLGW